MAGKLGGGPQSLVPSYEQDLTPVVGLAVRYRSALARKGDRRVAPCMVKVDLALTGISDILSGKRGRPLGLEPGL